MAVRQGRTVSRHQVGEQAAQGKTNEQVSVESRDRQELTLAVWLSSRKMSTACHECSTVHGSRDIMFPFLSFSLHTLPVQLPPFLHAAIAFSLFPRELAETSLHTLQKKERTNEMKDGLGRERRFKKCKSTARTVCHCQTIITRQRGTTSAA